jgi:MFS family permease
MISNRSNLWLAGLSATFTGNGIGRFAYITLMPALIQARWFSKEDAAQLGVATLIGYLLGPFCLKGGRAQLNRVIWMRGAMILCSLSYVCCAFPEMPFLWFYIWRFLAGLGGAILMILAAPMILPHIVADRRGLVSGLIFSGIGLGAALSGLLIPILVNIHISAAWLAMGLTCAVLTGLTWRTWGQLSPSLKVRNPPAQGVLPTQPLPAPQIISRSSFPARYPIGALLVAYAFNALGFLPHTLFWVDFLVRELGCSLVEGGLSWALFGTGAAIGPLLTGYLSDRWGVRHCLLVAFSLKAFGVVLPLLSTQLWVLHSSAFLVGMFTPGIVALVSLYALQLVGIQDHHRAWASMTFSFALTQAIGGLGMSFLLQRMQSYLPLYGISTIALIISILCIISIPNKMPKVMPQGI